MSVFGKTKTQAQQQPAYTSIDVQTSTAGMAISIVYGTLPVAPNLIWYGDFVATSHTNSAGSAGKGGGGASGSTTYTYGFVVLLAACEGPIQGFGTLWRDKDVTEVDSFFSTFDGTYDQEPWGYLQTYHPDQALNYPGVACAGTKYADLTSNDMPTHRFEVFGFYSNSVSGQEDADPSQVVTHFLSDPHCGCGFPSAMIGDLTVYQNYTLATGLLISMLLDEQQSASSTLTDLMTATNSEFVWSEGLLKIVPYGDQSVTGNGKTYTPPSTPLVDFDDDDYMIETTGDDPVQLTRSRPSDAYNSIQVEYLDRSNSYNTAIAEADDQASIDLYGLRRQSTSGTDMFATASVAQLSAQLQLQRQAIRNTYQWNTDERYIWLDPMDIVTLTDAWLGLDQQLVRITEIDLNDDGTLTFTAEEYLDGTGHAPAYSFQSGSGYTQNYNVDPGNTNAPVFLDAPVQIATTSGLEVWMVVSGGESFGGCDVYISADGDNYLYAGRSQGQGRQGFLTADLPVGTSPDTTHTASVDLSESGGALLSGTQNDADQGNTLCYVGGELIAYETATLTGANAYGLTYLNRGMYGSAIADHPSGTQFARLDQGKFVYSYDKSQIGQTIYVKLLAYNIYMGGNQTLDEVNPYTHLIQGPPLPPTVTGFNAQQNGGAVVFRWDESDDYALKGYDILYGPQGGGLTTAKFLTEATRGTEMTNASVPPGTWTFYIQGHDIADQVSATPATCTLTVTNQNELIAAPAQAPDWLGTLDGFVLHWTGVLVPLGTKTCDQYAVLSPPSAPGLASVSGGALAARTYAVVITYTTASGETLASASTSVSLAANTLLSVTSPATSGAAEGWNIYASAAGAETLQNAAPIQIGAGWTEPTTGLAGGAALPTANTTGWETFNVAVPDPVSVATYTAPTIDTEFNSTFRVFSTRAYDMLPGNTGVPSIEFELEDWLSGQSEPGTFAEFETGLITARYVRGQITATITPGSVPFISVFTPTVDIEPGSTTLNGVAISSAGTPITYTQQYHSLPNVQVTATGGGATSGVAVSETTTGCTIYLYNGSTAVSGTANLTITGV